MAFSRECREQILSEEYMDVITGEYWSPGYTDDRISGFCSQIADKDMRIVYLNRTVTPEISSNQYFYQNIPSLYIPLSTSALSDSGILQAADQPVLGLQGQGVILAFADTGIDYTHPAFRDSSGRTRITAIWDQTIQSGMPPEGFDYGTEFGRTEIDRALESETPFEMLPSRDEDGHGTYVAGVAAGSRVVSSGNVYQGAAPLSEIAVVKLKPAKKYLKEFYRVPETAQVFQENDIMLALRYFRELQKRLNRPMVVCFTLGSNMGGHDGGSPLGLILERISREYKMALVAAAGNEAVRAHHYYGTAEYQDIPDTVELQVAEQEEGFTLEIWPDLSELVTVSVTSPSGQQTEKFIRRPGTGSRILFVLEGTMLDVNFWYDASGKSSQIVTMKFTHPAQGLWKIQVYDLLRYGGGFHMWLPAEGLIRPGTVFLKPDVDVTLTDPSAGEHLVTVGAYDHVTDSIYLQSGRGKTRTGQQQPTIAAPGVSIDGPALRSVSGYEQRTGTSGAAAIAAGAAASVLTWGIVNGNLPVMTGTTVKFFLIIGAERVAVRDYPNNEWGYGTLNLYRIFEVLASLS
ncbi:MAG: S8 family peptidase [Lachnospiraceae bacterium]|nr:S8 family peptidase [Lachnospiraceae bacterium]